MAFLYVLDPAVGPVRDGHMLVVPRFGKGFAGVALPDVCVKCGSPATRSVDKTFYWHSPWVYLYLLVLFPLGILICFIASRMVRKGIELNVPFCQAHGIRRTRFLLVAGLLPLAGFILLLGLGFAGMNKGVAGGMEALLFSWTCLAGVIIAMIFWNPIRPKRVDEVCGVFTGCSEAFLRNLPVYKLATPAFQAYPAQQPSFSTLQGAATPPPPPPTR